MHADRPTYLGIIETGYSVGYDESSLNLWAVNTAHGIKMLNNHIFIGAGIGFGISTDAYHLKTYILPLFANIRYTLPLKNFAPYIDIKTGYAELTEETHDGGGDIHGGYYLAPSIGISKNISNRASIYIGVGYSLIQASYRGSLAESHGPSYTDESYVNKFNAGGFNMAIGFTF